MDAQDEDNRLAALHRLSLLDTDPEPEFDAVTDIAVALTGAKMAAVSLVDRDRQWFKSNINIPADETPRDIAFCHYAIQAPRLMHVEDALLDPRFADNDLVTGAPNIRGYAGIPLHEPGGCRIGTLCVIHDEPLHLDAGMKTRLTALGGVIEGIIAQRARAEEQAFSNRQLAAIADVQSEFITAGRSVDRAYKRLLDVAMELTGSELGIIGEIMEDRDGRYFSARVISDFDWPAALKAHFDAEMDGQLDFRLPDTLVGKVVHSGELLIENRASVVGMQSVPSGHPDIETFAAIPLYNGPDFIGALFLANREEGYQAETFDTLAPLLGTMANLIAESRAQRERLELLAQRERVNDRLLAVTELGGIGSWEVDLETGQPVWDAITRKIHEVGPDYVPVMEEAINFYAPEARDHISGLVAQGIETGNPWDVELPLITAKNNRIWVRAVGRAIRKNGEVVKLIGSFQDITARKNREDDFRTLSSRLELALGAAHVGVFEMNLASGFTWWDDGSQRMFEILEDDERDALEVWRSRLHPEDAPYLEERLARALDHAEPYDVFYRIRLADGELRHIRSQAVLRENIEGEPIFAGVNLDVTEEVRGREEIERRKEEADKANLAKSQFLANMSHEIRTPLNGVLGMAQLLRMTQLDGKQSTYVETLQNSGRALLELIEDILDISKIEAGVLELAQKPFDVTNTATSVVDMVMGLAREKELEVTLERADDIPDRVIGDEKRVRQILINMAGNAVKFTTHGHVRLSMRRSPNNRLRFEVEDTGPGIPDDQKARIFGRFAQVDDSATRAHGGTGLGLAICQEIVSLADGEIGVESEVGKGSTFWFEMPLPAAEAAEAIDATQRLGGVAREPGAPARVLIVDDVMTNQMVAAALLRGAGHSVELAGNGQEAIDALELSNFDAVLMDIQMPVMSGDEAIRRIRGSGKPYADIPIFAVTADATRGAEEKYTAAGANGYLVKPLDLPSVLAALSQALDKAA